MFRLWKVAYFTGGFAPLEDAVDAGGGGGDAYPTDGGDGSQPSDGSVDGEYTSAEGDAAVETERERPPKTCYSTMKTTTSEVGPPRSGSRRSPNGTARFGVNSRSCCRCRSGSKGRPRRSGHEQAAVRAVGAADPHQPSAARALQWRCGTRAGAAHASTRGGGSSSTSRNCPSIRTRTRRIGTSPTSPPNFEMNKQLETTVWTSRRLRGTRTPEDRDAGPGARGSRTRSSRPPRRSRTRACAPCSRTRSRRNSAIPTFGGSTRLSSWSATTSRN
jgi:hypothetical protein